jgi:hypothetical protein
LLQRQFPTLPPPVNPDIDGEAQEVIKQSTGLTQESTTIKATPRATALCCSQTKTEKSRMSKAGKRNNNHSQGIGLEGTDQCGNK